uniref:Uncharacterized protein n=1 Tax=Parascaris univalens TaxID=6257 RepID=A0A915BZT5_PARUN
TESRVTPHGILSHLHYKQKVSGGISLLLLHLLRGILRVLFAVLTVLGLLCCCGCIAGAAFAFRRRRIATE